MEQQTRRKQAWHPVLELRVLGLKAALRQAGVVGKPGGRARTVGRTGDSWYILPESWLKAGAGQVKDLRSATSNPLLKS